MRTEVSTQETEARNKRSAVLLALALVALAVAMSSLVEQARPAQAAFPGANGKIAFVSFGDENNDEIYSILTARRSPSRAYGMATERSTR